MTDDVPLSLRDAALKMYDPEGWHCLVPGCRCPGTRNDAEHVRHYAAEHLPGYGDLEDRMRPTANFILDRLDNVALWVIEWMPEEENEQHHNAVEHLVRIRQEVIRIARTVDPTYRPAKLSEDVALYLPDPTPEDIETRQRVRELTKKYRERRRTQ